MTLGRLAPAGREGRGPLRPARLTSSDKHAHPPHSLLGQIGRFAVVGGTNALVDFGVFDLLVWLAPTRDAGQLVAYNTVAVFCALANSYRWNSRWTFRGQAAHRGPAANRQRLLYMAQSCLNIVVNNVALALVTVVLNAYKLLSVYAANNVAKAVAVLTASAVSFVVMKWAVFRSPAESVQGAADSG
jgi:putative flippase GtrA